MLFDVHIDLLIGIKLVKFSLFELVIKFLLKQFEPLLRTSPKLLLLNNLANIPLILELNRKWNN